MAWGCPGRKPIPVALGSLLSRGPPRLSVDGPPVRPWSPREGHCVRRHFVASLPFLTSLMGSAPHCSQTPHHNPGRGLGRVASEHHAHPGLGVPLSPTLSTDAVLSRGAWCWGPSWAAPGAPSTLVTGARPTRGLVRLQGQLCWTRPCRHGRLHGAPPQGRPASYMAARDSVMNDQETGGRICLPQRPGGTSSVL